MFFIPVRYIIMRSKPMPKPGVVHAAEAAQIQIPPVGLFLQSVRRHLADPLQQHIVPLFALAAADDLADPRRQHVHRGHRLAIVVARACRTP